MADDPFRVFREGEEFRRECLSKIWPDLYDALARIGEPQRAWGCALQGHGDGDNRQYVPVVGRLHLNGTPACELHLRSSDRPGGYPLERQNPRKWRQEHGE